MCHIQYTICFHCFSLCGWPRICLSTITMSRTASPPPHKRPRHDGLDSSQQNANGNSSTGRDSLPPLSLSILGVEPLDEFIKEVADFIHHMIMTRPDYPGARIEVEAKIGVLRDRTTGQRLALPVCVETSTYPSFSLSLAFAFACAPGLPLPLLPFFPLLNLTDVSRSIVVVPDLDVRFESNMTSVRITQLFQASFRRLSCFNTDSNNTSIIIIS